VQGVVPAFHVIGRTTDTHINDELIGRESRLVSVPTADMERAALADMTKPSMGYLIEYLEQPGYVKRFRIRPMGAQLVQLTSRDWEMSQIGLWGFGVGQDGDDLRTHGRPEMEREREVGARKTATLASRRR